MLFRKDIDRFCAYCAHAGTAGKDRMICARREKEERAAAPVTV